MTLKAQLVDPRDQSWEIDRPAYRVYFWHPQGTEQDSMWASEEWELTDVNDVSAAIGPDPL